jgi:hypothetical protein
MDYRWELRHGDVVVEMLMEVEANDSVVESKGFVYSLSMELVVEVNFGDDEVS